MTKREQEQMRELRKDKDERTQKGQEDFGKDSRKRQRHSALGDTEPYQ